MQLIRLGCIITLLRANEVNYVALTLHGWGRNYVLVVKYIYAGLGYSVLVPLPTFTEQYNKTRRIDMEVLAMGMPFTNIYMSS